MSYWRSLLPIILSWFVLFGEAVWTAPAAQIQGYPVDVIYLKGRGGNSTNDIRASLAHYWQGNTNDLVGGAVLWPIVYRTNFIGGLSGQPEIYSDTASGLNFPPRMMNNLFSNADICPQFSLTNYLADPNPANLTNMSGGNGISFSMSAWVLPKIGSSGYGGCQAVADMFGKEGVDTDQNTTDWRFVRDNSSSALSFLAHDLTNNVLVQAQFIVGKPTNWVHCCVVYNDTTTNLLCYSNGVVTKSVALAGCQISTNIVTFFNCYSNLNLEPGTQKAFGEYVGGMGEIGWWTNKAITTQDVARLYNFGSGMPFNQFGKGWPAPALWNEGIISLHTTAPGNIYVTFDGTTPTYTLTGVTSGLSGASPPAGTYLYDGPFACPWTCILKAIDTNKFKPLRVLQTNLFSFGQNWSNNVVLNGGANPSAASANAINAFGVGLNNDLVITNLVDVNVIAADSLIASLTPCIYRFSAVGQQALLWVNHGFVGGDLTINGITGDGVAKYADTGVVPRNVFGTTANAGASVYSYNGTAAYAINGRDGSDVFYIDPHFTDGNAYAGNSADTITVTGTPGNGFYSDNRTASLTHILYFANSGTGWASVGTSGAVAFNGNATFPVFLNAQNNSGTANSFSTFTVSYVSFHFGLSTALGQKEFNRVQTLRTALGGGFR